MRELRFAKLPWVCLISTLCARSPVISLVGHKIYPSVVCRPAFISSVGINSFEHLLSVTHTQLSVEAEYETYLKGLQLLVDSDLQQGPQTRTRSSFRELV